MEMMLGASSKTETRPATYTPRHLVKSGGLIEFWLEANQATLSAAEGKTSAAQAMMADADARVAGRDLFS